MQLVQPPAIDFIATCIPSLFRVARRTVAKLPSPRVSLTSYKSPIVLGLGRMLGRSTFGVDLSSILSCCGRLGRVERREGIIIWQKHHTQHQKHKHKRFAHEAPESVYIGPFT
jgi:hypothetical protein